MTEFQYFEVFLEIYLEKENPQLDQYVLQVEGVYYREDLLEN